MFATDWKKEPDQNFSDAVCKRDWNVKIVFIF